MTNLFDWILALPPWECVAGVFAYCLAGYCILRAMQPGGFGKIGRRRK